MANGNSTVCRIGRTGTARGPIGARSNAAVSVSVSPPTFASGGGGLATASPAVTGVEARRGFAGREVARRVPARGFGARAAERGLRGLDLTDQQREQARAIMRANFESHKAQIEELKQLRQKGREGLSDADKARAKELHNQLRESRLSARNQLSSLLTAEQKTKLEERMKNRRERRERSGRRGMNRPI